MFGNVDHSMKPDENRMKAILSNHDVYGCRSTTDTDGECTCLIGIYESQQQELSTLKAENQVFISFVKECKEWALWIKKTNPSQTKTKGYPNFLNKCNELLKEGE